MDIRRLNHEAMPGRLIRISDREHAFLPDPLPPAVALTSETLELVAEARERISFLRGLTDPLSLPDPTILLRPLQIEESLRSSSLEGTYAPNEDLLLFELDPQDTPASAEQSHTREVANLRQTLQRAASHLDGRRLSAHDIRSMHQMLLNNVRGGDKQPGEFRSGQVFIGSDHRYIPPPAHLVQECMNDLVAYWSAPADDLPPLVRALMAHYQFEAIHPFRDGNGRIGRVILTLMIAQCSQLNAPWVHLSAFFEDHRAEYFDALLHVSTDGDWLRWVHFGLRAISSQASDAADRCRQLLSLKQQWLEALQDSDLKSRTFALVDRLLALPVIDVESARQALQVRNYRTARADLEQLARIGLIEVIPDRYPLTYRAPAVQRIIFRRAGD